tara:strand:+ start:174 stop:404 length:231 start_codon:yes stop_codon:yes gene_type:complete
MKQIERHTDLSNFSEKSIRNLDGFKRDLQEAVDGLGHANTAAPKRYYWSKPGRVKHFFLPSARLFFSSQDFIGNPL